MHTNVFKRFVTFTTIVGLLSLAAPVTAAIISNPASLVDHGTYITDTANNLDWFKFGPTLGLSFDAAVAANASGGWQGATLGQIHSLWSEFGYVSDTPLVGGGFNANAGLTDALAGYLGFTWPGNPPPAGCCGNRYVAAYRAELASPGIHWTTFSEIDVITNSTNDAVDSFYPAPFAPTVGTWLVRPIPEPDTYAMLGLGLGVMGWAGRRRRLKAAA